MDEEYGYEYDEGSDIDNWENEEVFQDHEGRDEELDYDYDRDEAPDYENWLEQAGEMMMEDLLLPEN